MVRQQKQSHKGGHSSRRYGGGWQSIVTKGPNNEKKTFKIIHREGTFTKYAQVMRRDMDMTKTGKTGLKKITLIHR